MASGMAKSSNHLHLCMPRPAREFRPFPSSKSNSNLDEPGGELEELRVPLWWYAGEELTHCAFFQPLDQNAPSNAGLRA